MLHGFLKVAQNQFFTADAVSAPVASQKSQKKNFEESQRTVRTLR